MFLRIALRICIGGACLAAGCATTSDISPAFAPGQLTNDISRILARRAFAPTGALHTWPELLAQSGAVANAASPATYATAMNGALDGLGVSVIQLLPPEDAILPPEASIAWVDSRVAIIRIPSLVTAQYQRRRVERLFEAAFWARAIILDLRATSGHAPGEAEHLAGLVLHSGTPLGRILDPPEFNAYLRRADAAPSLADAGVYAAERLKALPSPGLPQAYAGEVCVLVDRQTQGAGELLARAIQHALRGPVLGEPTRGYGYEVRQVKLSGGWELVFPVAAVLGPDGSPREGQGLQPDIPLAAAQMADTASFWPLLRQFGSPVN